jgi:hypothetical protein
VMCSRRQREDRQWSLNRGGEDQGLDRLFFF